MTLIDIAEYIAERAGRQYDKPFNLEMQNMVVAVRARYMANRLQKNPRLSVYYTQSFSDTLIDVNKDECSELAECGCENVKRTTNKIPKPFQIGIHPFTYVGPVTGINPYGWTTFGTENYLKESPIVGKLPRYTYLNDYIYVFNDKNGEKIKGEGMFPDPRLLKTLQGCNGNATCYSDSLDFPIEEELIAPIREEILRLDLRMPPILEEKIEVTPDKNV